MQQLIHLLTTASPTELQSAALKMSLEQAIRHLIEHHFADLITILYGLDVSESIVNDALKAGTTADAASLMAGRIIERQLVKMELRHYFPAVQNIPDDEKW